MLLGVGSLALVAAYPFMKRITWWPQAWLGLTFNWGALMAFAAAAGILPFFAWAYARLMMATGQWPIYDTLPGVNGSLTAAAALLYLGGVFWTLGYDTIYALQDIEDDALVGVRSTARLFGPRWRDWTFGFYLIALVLWGAAAALAGSVLVTGVALGVIGSMLIWPTVSRVEAGQPASALAAFKANVWIGLAVAGAFALPGLWRTLQPFLVQ